MLWGHRSGTRQTPVKRYLIGLCFWAYTAMCLCSGEAMFPSQEAVNNGAHYYSSDREPVIYWLIVSVFAVAGAFCIFDNPLAWFAADRSTDRSADRFLDR